MVQQMMLRLFLIFFFKKRSGESDSQNSQSSSRTDKVGLNYHALSFLQKIKGPSGFCDY